MVKIPRLPEEIQITTLKISIVKIVIKFSPCTSSIIKNLAGPILVGKHSRLPNKFTGAKYMYTLVESDVFVSSCENPSYTFNCTELRQEFINETLYSAFEQFSSIIDDEYSMKFPNISLTIGRVITFV